MKNNILKNVNLKGINLQFYDFYKSSTFSFIANEINNDSYDIAIDNKVNLDTSKLTLDPSDHESANVHPIQSFEVH
mgnify:CR=1 FL=1